MVIDSGQQEALLEPPALKTIDPEIDPGDIWHHDKLDRKGLAARLTYIIEDQRAPFVICLDGRWGSGKTFLLQRWQRDLAENGDFHAIYFNAWEDDYCEGDYNP
ncbi:MAG: P-loop NTPase fold protein [Chloroflexota bacterium]|nr:P-loop NTPase fold protein [Chloroflexota bacterium]